MQQFKCIVLIHLTIKIHMTVNCNIPFIILDIKSFYGVFQGYSIISFPTTFGSFNYRFLHKFWNAFLNSYSHHMWHLYYVVFIRSKTHISSDENPADGWLFLHPTDSRADIRRKCSERNMALANVGRRFLHLSYFYKIAYFFSFYNNNIYIFLEW